MISQANEFPIVCNVGVCREREGTMAAARPDMDMGLRGPVGKFGQLGGEMVKGFPEEDGLGKHGGASRAGWG